MNRNLTCNLEFQEDRKSQKRVDVSLLCCQRRFPKTKFVERMNQSERKMQNHKASRNRASCHYVPCSFFSLLFSFLLRWSLLGSPWNTVPMGRPQEKPMCTSIPMRMLLQLCSRIGLMFVSAAHDFHCHFGCLSLLTNAFLCFGVYLDFFLGKTCSVTTTKLNVKRTKHYIVMKSICLISLHISVQS